MTQGTSSSPKLRVEGTSSSPPLLRGGWGGVFSAAWVEIMAASAPDSIALCQKSPPSTRVPGIPKNKSPDLQAWELVDKPLTSASRAGCLASKEMLGTAANNSLNFI